MSEPFGFSVEDRLKHPAVHGIQFDAMSSVMEKLASLVKTPKTCVVPDKTAPNWTEHLLRNRVCHIFRHFPASVCGVYRSLPIHKFHQPFPISHPSWVVFGPSPTMRRSLASVSGWSGVCGAHTNGHEVREK